MPDISEVKVNGIEHDIKDATAREHINADNIKTYTSLEQLGLADTDFTGMTIVEVMDLLIYSKMPAYSMLNMAFSINTFPTFGALIAQKITEDLGIEVQDGNFFLFVNKTASGSFGTPVLLYGDTGTLNRTTLMCMFDKDEGVANCTKFIYHYLPQGFLPLTGGILLGNELYNGNGFGRWYAAANAAVFSHLGTAGEKTKNVKGIAVYNGETLKEAFKLLSIDENGEYSIYNIFGEHNVPTLLQIGGSNQNLLDNWYFADPINQRGLTEYTEPGYGIDRWYLRKNTKATFCDGYIRLTAGGAGFGFNQRIENYAELLGKTVTIAVLIRDVSCAENSVGIRFGVCASNHPGSNSEPYPGTYTKNKGLITYTATLPDSIEYSGLNFEMFSNYVAEGDYIDVVAAKLELGSEQTLAYQDAAGNWILNDPYPNKQQELAKCQRYYWRTTLTANGYAALPNAIAYGTGVAISTLQLPVTMRTVPAVLFNAGTKSALFVNDEVSWNATEKLITGVELNQYNGNVIHLKLLSSGLTLGKVYQAQIASGYIELSADL